MSRLSSHLVCLVAVCVLSACRDRGAEAFARAELQYRALLAEAAAPHDARFDAVLKDLGQVPSSSKHFVAAKALIHGIEAGRERRVRTPLALVPNGRRSSALEAQLAACARLAQLAGLDGGIDRHTLEALEACRFRAEKLELQQSHGEDFDAGSHH